MEKKHVFNPPYLGMETDNGLGILYANNGDHSVIIKMNNPIQQYDADVNSYNDFHSLFENIIKVVGQDYIIQKQDILTRKQFIGKPSEDFLSQKYFDNFSARKYTDLYTYLVVTKQAKKKRYQFDEKEYAVFKNNINKVFDILANSKLQPKILDINDASEYAQRVLSMDFADQTVQLNNFKATDDYLEMGEDIIKSISLINIDVMEIPSRISPAILKNDIGDKFPVDLMAFLFTIPDYQTIIFNQLIFIPDQTLTLAELEVKRRRHVSIPDAGNTLSAQDIEALFEDVSKDNQLLVNAHFNVLIKCNKKDIDKTTNYITTQLFNIGVTPSKQTYNQLELFRTALPGNANELQNYDKFLTSADAAICFFFKERLLKDEDSSFQIYFSDRQGVPVAVDTNEAPREKGIINNRNKFVLGPSGSGKSFFMNHLCRQYFLFDMDIILVDTGHSYAGLCDYYNGTYVTYTDENPITMNPFVIGQNEYNEEKRDFIKSLIKLIWKGTDGVISKVEDTVIGDLVVKYYENYFAKQDEAAKDKSKPQPKASFNSFYDFAVDNVKLITDKAEIPFDLPTFRYILKDFYVGGKYERTLNKDIDQNLFDQKFIVFEIDAIKENKILFPIVTIIIMDVFLQKMRHKKNRKALIIEEAWKAIASPMMAEYILYLYKTVRKFWGEAIVVTQELGDIIGNAVVKDSIINNSDTTILLDQSSFKDNFDEIAALLSISEVERKKIFTINKLDNRDGRGKFKEVYIKSGSKGAVYGVENSLEEYMVFTTERQEKEALQPYIKAYGGTARGVEEFVKDFKKRKISLSEWSTFINKAVQNEMFHNRIDEFISAYKSSKMSLDEFITKVNRGAFKLQAA